MWRKSWRSVSLAISPSAPASSTPVGPPPTITKFSQARRSAGSVLALGAFEGQQQAAADLGGVLDGLQAGRDGFPLVVAEIVVGGAGGDDQRVVGHFAVAQDDLAVGGVEIDDFAEQDFGVAIVLEHDPQGRGDFAGREPAGRHLVEQRLEEVEVAAVDQGDR